MASPATSYPPDPADQFETATLRGGPHDGQSCRLPKSQDEVTFFDDAEPHQYVRLGVKPEFHHQGRIDALLGGRR